MHLVQGTLNYSLSGHAVIFSHQFLLKRARINAHSDRNVPLLGNIHNRLHLINAADITRINPYLICAVLHSGNRHLIIKMNICHKRNMNLLLNLCNSLRRCLIRHGTANNLTSGLLQLKYLSHTGFHILCLHISHRLNGYRVASAYRHITNIYNFCLVSVHFFTYHILCYFYRLTLTVYNLYPLISI